MKSPVFILIILILAVAAGAGFSNFSINFTNSKLAAIKNNIPTESGKTLFTLQSNNLTKEVDPELVELDSQIISCSPSVDSLFSNNPSIGGSCLGAETVLSDKNVKGKFLGGQCCGAMKDTKEYHEHLGILKEKYSKVPEIPLNPFKTPVELAKKWIDYDRQTILSEGEQKIYNNALSMSKEGPCCCKCWHYYVNEGIGKKMIKDYGYSAKQVADFWDVSDICGNS